MKWVFVASLILLFIFAPPVFARSGCCSWHSGVCGCSCCDGTPLSATCLPYYPGCSGGGGGITIPTLRPIPTTPTCPLMSYYDSITGNCKCYSGYVASGDRCISQDQACQDSFGFNSRFNSLHDSCECRYGYVWNEARTKCVDGNQACWDKYGYNATYDSLDNSCKCSYGYVWSDGKDTCISQSQYCTNKYGTGSMYDVLKDGCKCGSGYKFENNRCTLETLNIPEVKGVFFSPTATPFVPSPTKVPTPTKKPIPTEKIVLTPTTSVSSMETINKMVQTTSNQQSKKQGLFEWLFSIFFGNGNN